MVLVCDPDGVISYASPAVGDYGYAPGDLTGRRLLDFVHPEDRGAVRTASRLALALGLAEAPPSAGRFPARVRAADGTRRHVESTVLRYQLPGGPRQIMVTARDVSDQVALRQQVAHLTFHDGLTGLPNRAYVEERTRDVLRDAAPTSRIGVIFLDLDRFTAVNDSVGHGAGGTSCWPRPPGGCGPPSRSTARLRAGAVTSSPSWSRTRPARRRSPRSANGWSARLPPSRSGWPASRLRSPRAWAWP